MLAALVTLHVTRLVTTIVTVVSSQELIIQMTSLMHHSSTPMRTGICNPNQCSTSYIKCQFTPPAFCQFIISMGLLQPYFHAR